jgi:hypothetical protein
MRKATIKWPRLKNTNIKCPRNLPLIEYDFLFLWSIRIYLARATKQSTFQG